MPRRSAFPLRFLLATNPALIGRVLGIVYRVIAGHLVRQAGYTQQTARTGAVTRATAPLQGFSPCGQVVLAFPPALIQRFGSALNLNIHFHMLFLDGVYVVDAPHRAWPRFQWVREPTSAQLGQLAHTIARRVGRLLEREGLLERETEQLDLGEALDTDDPAQAMEAFAAFRVSGNEAKPECRCAYLTLPATPSPTESPSVHTEAARCSRSRPCRLAMRTTGQRAVPAIWLASL